jgi:uncharacterized protein
MDLVSLIPGFLHRSWHGRLLEELHALYAGLDLAIEAWQRASSMGCPPGCGTCCTRYEPTVMPVEGMAIAAYAAASRPSTIPVLEAPGVDEGPGCVLFDPVSPFHCTVYPARPLECRLFGFSATRDKDGDPVFRLCRHMPAAFPRTMDRGVLASRFGALPPVMQDHSTRLAALAALPALPLREHARSAWATVTYLQRLSEGDAGQQQAGPGCTGDRGRLQ